MSKANRVNSKFLTKHWNRHSNKHNTWRNHHGNISSFFSRSLFFLRFLPFFVSLCLAVVVFRFSFRFFCCYFKVCIWMDPTHCVLFQWTCLCAYIWWYLWIYAFCLLSVLSNNATTWNWIICPTYIYFSLDPFILYENNYNATQFFVVYGKRKITTAYKCKGRQNKANSNTVGETKGVNAVNCKWDNQNRSKLFEKSMCEMQGHLESISSLLLFYYQCLYIEFNDKCSTKLWQSQRKHK